MSIATASGTAPTAFSTRAMSIYATVTAISFSAVSSAPTPLYHLYQQTMGLAPLTITMIFAVYAFAMLAALLTVGSLSDYVGRRPMILAGLLLNAVALVLFVFAGSAAMLILARMVQGVATGIAMTTLGATILDTDRTNGPVINSLTALVGLTIGSLLAGGLIALAPFPGQLVYLVLLAVTLAETALLAVLPETGAVRKGAMASLRPRVRVPPVARPAMVRLLPLNLAAWALGGFYFSLMPTLVTIATRVSSPFVGAAVVAALSLTGAAGVFALRGMAPARQLRFSTAGLGLGIAVTLAGIWAQSVPMLFVGTVVAGLGFGTSYSGNLRTLLPLADATDRAGLLAAYLVESYLAFSLPAIAAGLLAPMLGLVATSYLYGGVLIGLVALSVLLALRPWNRTPSTELPPRLG